MRTFYFLVLPVFPEFAEYFSEFEYFSKFRNFFPGVFSRISQSIFPKFKYFSGFLFFFPDFKNYLKDHFFEFLVFFRILSRFLAFFRIWVFFRILPKENGITGSQDPTFFRICYGCQMVGLAPVEAWYSAVDRWVGALLQSRPRGSTLGYPEKSKWKF